MQLSAMLSSPERSGLPQWQRQRRKIRDYGAFHRTGGVAERGAVSKTDNRAARLNQFELNGSCYFFRTILRNMDCLLPTVSTKCVRFAENTLTVFLNVRSVDLPVASVRSIRAAKNDIEDVVRMRMHQAFTRRA